MVGFAVSRYAAIMVGDNGRGGCGSAIERQRAIVRGGSRGIGKAIARQLAEEGVEVAIAARGREQFEATAAEITKATGCRVVPIVADMGDDATSRRLVASWRLGEPERVASTQICFST